MDEQPESDAVADGTLQDRLAEIESPASATVEAVATLAPAMPEDLDGEDPIYNIPVTVQVILGTTKMPLAKVMAVGPGSVIMLRQKLEDPVSVMVNGKEIAKGHIVVVDGEEAQLGISLTEIAAPQSGRKPPAAT